MDNPTKQPVRVHVFIDGYNVYVPLAKHYNATGENYKWVDYRKVATKLLATNHQFNGYKTKDLQVSFFTALPTWNDKKKERHELFVEACKLQDIEVYEGRFNRNRDEKETDISIAIELYRQASKNLYDVAILLTGDTDFVPCIKAFREDFPEKAIFVVTPPMAQKCTALEKALGKPLISTTVGLYGSCQLSPKLAIKSPYLC
jgi:uncharacterized LabA/DUF88 family protein